MAQPLPPLFIVFDLRAAGAGLVPVAQQLSARLQAAGRAHELLWLGEEDELGTVAGRAVHAAREAEGAVVVAGPPAVVNAVAQLVWNARLVFGVLPLEAGVEFAVGDALASDPDKAAQALQQARVQEQPVGLLGERVFITDAELGLLPWTAHTAASAAHPADGGGLRAWRSNLASLLGSRSLLTLQAHAHGRTRVVRTRSLRVRCPPPAERAPDIAKAPAVGQWLATSLRPPPLPQALWRAARGLGGQVQDAAALDSFGFERLLVRPRRGGHAITVRLDGEILSMHAPLLIQPAPWPLRLLLPAASPAGAV
ncbi:MAG: hypothetical protein IPG98_03160 [Burkholderiales bacterium]|nr:hypothetical protein [Burkholderiales bacterium]MBK8665679.1 hypothetical protein [Burkholderiales bacterium]